MASPASTKNQVGLAGQTLAAATAVSFSIDATTKFALQAQFKMTTGGTVAATAGLQVQIFRNVKTTPLYDTIPFQQFVVPVPTVSPANTTTYQSIELPTGHYQFTLTNLDQTNGLAAVECDYLTVDSVS